MCNFYPSNIKLFGCFQIFLSILPQFLLDTQSVHVMNQVVSVVNFFAKAKKSALRSSDRVVFQKFLFTTLTSIYYAFTGRNLNICRDYGSFLSIICKDV